MAYPVALAAVKAQDHFEEVTVDADIKASAAGKGETAGNGKPQSGPLGGSCLIPPNKALHDLIGVKVHLVVGYILDLHLYPFSRDQVYIYPGRLHGVFQRVGNEVLEHPVEPLAVAHDINRRVGHIHPEGQTRLLYLLLHVGQCLFQEPDKINPLQIKHHVPACCLAELKKVLDKSFEPVGLLRKDLDVFPYIVRKTFLFGNQVVIADY